MKNTKTANLTKVITMLRDTYLSEYASSCEEINNGLCMAFAEEVQGIVTDCGELSNDYLVKNVDAGWNGGREDEWCLRTLKKVTSLPPIPIKELNQMDLGYHRWLYYEGYHFDVECPYGVKNLFDLPFFKRYIKVKANGKVNEKENLSI